MKKKYEVWLPLLFSVVLVAGMFLGYRFSSTQPNNDFFYHNTTSSLQEAMDIIKLRYVDTVDTDSLEYYAIQEMMNELDPHSAFLPPVDLKQETEDLSGNFQGIGVEFNLVRDTVNVTYVIENGPSEKAGLEIGDQIVKVNNLSLTGKGMTLTKVRNSIRGESGSVANLQVVREGSSKLVAVTRGFIPTPSVIAAYMVDKKIGYIKFYNRFSSLSYREFMQSMELLQKQGMTELIFDLRGNGGGYFDQAIDIVDEFLDGDKLIVYTEGTNSPKKEYRCKRPGIFEKGKLTVLVDDLSASASEIVAGALQDWDRATIIGRRTFGKGLVQEIFPLSDGSALKLTIARYYTPLGRSIQRSYEEGKEEYLDEVWQRYANGQVYYADSNKVIKGKKFVTPGGKVLYGGGGIMPDMFVGLDTTRYSREINRLFINGTFNDFVFHYYLQHKEVLAQFSTPTAYAKGFEPSKNMWQSFVSWARQDTIDLSKLPNMEKQRVEDRMRANLARYKWRDNGFYEVYNTKDPVVLKALEVLRK